MAIYSDKFTLLDVEGDKLLIRNVKQEIIIERNEIKSIVHAKPKAQTTPPLLDSIVIKTTEDKLICLPVESEQNALKLLRVLSEFWIKTSK